MSETYDIVYTWVDDSWPGYADTLAYHAGDAHDRNPNRTRDNLDLLKFSLRSLVAHCPFVSKVYLVTAAPQIPRWLDTSTVRVVHHDAILEQLPTFNSFAILSALHHLPGLSERFLYVEDDMLFGRSISPDDFRLPDGRLRLYPRLNFTQSPHDTESMRLSPWNRALAHSNALLDAQFGKRRRRLVGHMPLLIDKAWWREMAENWPKDFARTRASRFRSTRNVAPEHLYPWFLLHTGRAVMESLGQTWCDAAYVPLENTPLISALALARARGRKFMALNDGFGAMPRPAIVKAAKNFLTRGFPVKSRFEL
ncbi:MAG: stealth conserved region 3 domain-containing protein [Alphaproteobacteria bacterium]|nr:stealth conserved region 3 domain-containing protein [Alphaproteobacteria bacterium]